MAFVALYVERAAESEPATWRGLTEPRVAKPCRSCGDRPKR